MLNKELQEKLTALIVHHLNPDFIVLLGSYAKGTAHDARDIE